MTDNPYHDPWDKPERFAQYEYQLGVDSMLPILGGWGIDPKGLSVIDLGCGAGGLTVALAERGACCLGIDRNNEQIARARILAAEHGVAAEFQAADILELHDLNKPADLMILAEIVEHLETRDNVGILLSWCRRNLAANGLVLVSFPPWYSPFAGHQAGWPGIRYVPWYHLFPDYLKRLLVPKLAPRYIDFARELNHLTLAAFEAAAKHAGLCIDRCILYHARPEYHWRYGIPIVPSLPILSRIAILREITTTGAYFLLVHS